jgi:hypothetical protein
MAGGEEGLTVTVTMSVPVSGLDVNTLAALL